MPRSLLVLLISLASCCLAAPVNFLPPDAAALRARLSSLRAPKQDEPDRYFEIFPAYKATAMPGAAAVSFDSSCFSSVKAKLVRTAMGADLSLSVGRRRSLTCDEGYLVAFVGAMDLLWFEEGHTTQTAKFEGNYTEAHLYDLEALGVRVFQFRHGSVSTVAELLDTLTLFVGYLTGQHMPAFSVEANVRFLADRMNYSMPERPVQRVDLPMSEVHSGDLLVITRLDGLDPMLMWAMGARAAHLAVVVEYKPGVLYVCESNTESEYWPVEGLACTEWAKWIDHVEGAEYLVSLVPLKPEARAAFDTQAAVRWLDNGILGLPYGFHNLVTGWIDTDEDNYPHVIESHMTMLVLQAADWLMQDVLHAGSKGDIFAGDMNKRLGTQGLNVAEVFMEAGKRGISFQDLAKSPEQDSWTFKNNDGSEGPSMVCCVFVAAVYKAGGLFGNVSADIQVTEFTNYDVYTLDFFDKNWDRPEICKKTDPNVPFCQLLGKYQLSLEPEWGTKHPFPHMAENCPSKEPLYIRPDRC